MQDHLSCAQIVEAAHIMPIATRKPRSGSSCFQSVKMCFRVDRIDYVVTLLLK
jgi:hypothetical protein